MTGYGGVGHADVWSKVRSTECNTWKWTRIGDASLTRLACSRGDDVPDLELSAAASHGAYLPTWSCDEWNDQQVQLNFCTWIASEPFEEGQPTWSARHWLGTKYEALAESITPRQFRQPCPFPDETALIRVRSYVLYVLQQTAACFNTSMGTIFREQKIDGCMPATSARWPS